MLGVAVGRKGANVNLAILATVVNNALELPNRFLVVGNNLSV